jgi:proteasome lid subunit RPN8/RPN11
MIKIAKQVFETIEYRAVEDLPYEACGLLVGNRETDCIAVNDILFSVNVSESDPRQSFEIDPALYIKLQKQARAGGPDVVGVWHSHPGGQPEPSTTDKMLSVEKNWVWLITSASEQETQTKGYLTGSDTPNEFTEVSISIVN